MVKKRVVLPRSRAISTSIVYSPSHEYVLPSFILAFKPLNVISSPDSSIKEKDIQDVLKSFCVSICCECLHQFGLLESGFCAYAQTKHIFDLPYIRLEQRFTVSENYDEYKIGFGYTDMHKLQNEIAIGKFLLRQLLQEGTAYDSVFMFYEYTKTMSLMKSDEENLIKEIESKKSKIRELMEEIVNIKRTYENLEKNYIGWIQEKLTEYKDLAAYKNAEVQYAKQWQESRTEQNRLRLEKCEQNLNSTISTMLWSIDKEDMVHDDVEKYIREAEEEHRNDIMKWMDEYDRVLDQKEMQNLDKRAEMDRLHQEMEQVQQEFAKRRAQMDAYKEWKRHKEEEARLEALQNSAAITIQVWWRNIMTAKKLYRKKKEKKVKKGKKAKK